MYFRPRGALGAILPALLLAAPLAEGSPEGTCATFDTGETTACVESATLGVLYDVQTEQRPAETTVVCARTFGHAGVFTYGMYDACVVHEDPLVGATSACLKGGTAAFLGVEQYESACMAHEHPVTGSTELSLVLLEGAPKAQGGAAGCASRAGGPTGTTAACTDVRSVRGVFFNGAQAETSAGHEDVGGVDARAVAGNILLYPLSAAEFRASTPLGNGSIHFEMWPALPPVLTSLRVCQGFASDARACHSVNVADILP